MKNIRSIVIAGITAVMAFSVCSCDSYLDVDRYIYDMTSLDSIFKRNLARAIYKWCFYVFTA